MTQSIAYRKSIRQFVAQMGDRFILPENLQQNGKKNRFDGAARRLAERMARTRLRKTSVRGLESLAWSTDSVGDILDYIRIRTGRDTKNEEWGAANIGVDLANILERLYEEAAKHLGKVPREQIQPLHLELCREFIKHLVAYFEFEVSGGWRND